MSTDIDIAVTVEFIGIFMVLDVSWLFVLSGIVRAGSVVARYIMSAGHDTAEQSGTYPKNMRISSTVSFRPLCAACSSMPSAVRVTDCMVSGDASCIILVPLGGTAAVCVDVAVNSASTPSMFTEPRYMADTG